MKPNFTLILSHDGIGLLHRIGGGWSDVGQVRLDDPEFQQKLAHLRQTAAALESGGVTTKLVIPESQILYKTVAAPGPTEAERHNQIRAALTDATPYAVGDLVYDWRVDGDTVNVAAVALETLQEAEGFASEHGFNPLSFIAIPSGEMFGRGDVTEPYFGMTAGAETVLEGTDTVERDSGLVKIISAPQVPTPTPDDTAPTEIKPEVKPEAPDAAPKPKAEDVRDTPVKPEPAAEKSVAPADDKAPEIAAKKAPDETPNKADGAKEGDAALPAFSTRRDVETPEKEDTQTLDRIEKIASRLLITPDSVGASAPKLGGANRNGDDPAQAAATQKPDTVAIKTPVAGVTEAMPAVVVPPAKPEVAAAVPETPKTKKPKKAKPVKTAKPKSEKQRMTIFGARKKTVERGKPRFLGLILMLILFLTLAAIAIWSSSLDDDLAFWRSGPDTPEVIQASGVGQGAGATSTVSGALAALTEPNSRATQEGGIAAPMPIELAMLDQDALVTTNPSEIFDGELDVEPDTMFGQFDPDATPQTDVSDTNAVTPISPEAARAAYAQTGVWQLAPSAPKAAREDDIETLYIASIDPTVFSHDAVALPRLPVIASDQAFEAQAVPAAASSTFVFDERGLVIPTVEGTLTPDGITVYAGPPPKRPAERGDRTPVIVIEPDLRLAGFKPVPRPANVTVANETARLGGYTRAQLEALRPNARPAAPKVEEEADETPTDQAVILSSAPRHRPSGFSKIVARARAQEQPSDSGGSGAVATAVPRSQTTAPAIPTRTSVARAATVRNAINLRLVNLIGVYGSPSKRRALVRLRNGRYVKVKVGGRMDGGKVVALGESELRYVKGGRTITLKMPRT